MQKLAQKFNVSIAGIKRRAAKEKWTEERTKSIPKVYQKTTEKIIEKIADQESSRIAKILSAGDMLLNRVIDATGELGTAHVKNTASRRTIDKENGTVSFVKKEDLGITNSLIDTRSTRNIATSLKILKEIVLTSGVYDEALSKVDRLLEGVTDAAKR